MSNWVDFSGAVPRYLTAQHTPKYEGNPDFIKNPDMSAVEGVEPIYWKRVGDAVVEMSQAEKDNVVAAATLAQAVDEADRINRMDVSVIDLAKALVDAGVISAPDLKTALRNVM